MWGWGKTKKIHHNPTYQLSLRAQLNRRLTLHIPRYTVFCMLSKIMLHHFFVNFSLKKFSLYTDSWKRKLLRTGKSLVPSTFELTITTSATRKRRFLHTPRRTKTYKAWLWSWKILFCMNCSPPSPLLPIVLYTFLQYFCRRNYLHKINLDDIMRR